MNLRKLNKMKKINYLLIFMIIVVGILLYFLVKPRTLSDEKILSVIKPEIENYCESLENQLKDNNYATNCPSCVDYAGYEIVNGTIFGQGTRNHLIDIKKSDTYLVNVKIQIIYGYTTHGGELGGYLIIDKKGNILEENIPKLGCL